MNLMFVECRLVSPRDQGFFFIKLPSIECDFVEVPVVFCRHEYFARALARPCSYFSNVMIISFAQQSHICVHER